MTDSERFRTKYHVLEETVFADLDTMHRKIQETATATEKAVSELADTTQNTCFNLRKAVELSATQHREVLEQGLKAIDKNLGNLHSQAVASIKSTAQSLVHEYVGEAAMAAFSQTARMLEETTHKYEKAVEALNEEVRTFQASLIKKRSQQLFEVFIIVFCAISISFGMQRIIENRFVIFKRDASSHIIYGAKVLQNWSSFSEGTQKELSKLLFLNITE